ncbi:MAG: hypothetical protein RL477_1062 [Pseudomonadota bacterium]
MNIKRLVFNFNDYGKYTEGRRRAGGGGGGGLANGNGRRRGRFQAPTSVISTPLPSGSWK